MGTQKLNITLGYVDFKAWLCHWVPLGKAGLSSKTWDNADGQQAHEKMLNITNHQGNANQNHNEISPHTCQNGYHQKEHK